MPKSYKVIKHHRRKSRRFRKSRKNRTRRHYPSYRKNLARGPSPASITPTTNIPCCMCDRSFARDTMLTPLRCLQTYGERAHRICEDCWWDPQIGFAREDAPHGCPGCKRGLPLNPPLKSRKPTEEEIIVISD